MLSLDSPQWSELQHAYGPATDIPQLLWPPVRTCTNMASLKVLFQGHGAESVKEARSAGLTGHQRMRCPGVEGGRRQEENDLIDSFRRTRNVRTIRFFMHFHTGQKHPVSARRSQLACGLC